MTSTLQQMFKNKKLFLSILGIALSLSAKAQDPEFTQFYAAPVYTNPAMAGTAECGGRVVMNYRNQWPGLSGTFQTVAASYDQQFNKINGAFGLLAMKDVAGDGLLTTNTVNGIYSYLIKVNRKFNIRAGIQAGYIQRSVDHTKLRFSDQVEIKRGFTRETLESFPNTSKGFANFSTGFVGYTKNFFAGFAVHNITEPNQSFFGNTDDGTTLPRRLTVHAGTVIPLKKTKKNQEPEMTISPNIILMTQRKFVQVNFGFYLNKGPFVTGLWYRQTSPNSDAMMVLLGFRYNKFKFGYSYDITVSKARPAAPGSHEVSASIEWCHQARKKISKLRCPDF